MELRDPFSRKLPEIEPQNTLAILSAIVEGTTDAIYVKDAAGRYIMINSAGAGWLGKSVIEVVGKTDRDLFPPDTAQRIGEADREIFATGKPRTFEESMRVGDKQITSQSVKAPYKDSYGHVIGIIGISRDISEIKESRSALEKSYSLVQATLESTADGILVVDNQERITGYNQMFLALWRIPQDQIEKLGYKWALKFALGQLSHPEKFLERLHEIDRYPDHESHDLLELKDGRVFERYSRPQRIGDTIVGRVFSYRDITSRVMSERALQEGEKRVTRFLDKLPIGLAVFDSDGKLHYANENAHLILGREIRPGTDVRQFQKDYHAFVAGTEQPYPFSRMPSTRALRGEPMATCDDLETRLDGISKILQVWASPIYDSRNQLDFALVAFRDITAEKKQSNERESFLSLLQATLDSTNDGILVVDTKGKIVTCNRNFVEIWSVPEKMLESHDDASIIDWVKYQLKSPDQFTSKVEELYANPERESYDSIEFKSGRVLERYSRPHRLREKIVGRVWSFRDVTARVRAEASLKESEARKAAIFSSAIDPIITMDRNGNIVELNPAAEKAFGYISAYAVGRTLASLIIPPRLQEAHRLGLARYLKTGESHFLGKRTELPAMRADGTEFPAEVSIIQTRFTDQSLFTGFIRDISERKKNEALIRQGAAQIKALVEVSREIIAARLDLNKILDAIARSVSEYFQDGCVVRLFSEDGAHLTTVAFKHVDPVAQSFLEPLLERAHDFIDKRVTIPALEAGKPFVVSGSINEIRARLGPEHWSALDRFPVHSWVVVPLIVTGKLLGTITVFRHRVAPPYSVDDNIWLQEVADRAALSIGNAKLYLDAKRAIQLREDFMSIASHELKTPLTPLKMQLQLLSHLVQTGVAVPGPLGEKLKDVISESDQQIGRLTRLVEDILDTTRLRTGQFALKREEVDLNSLILGVIQRMKESDMPGKEQIEFHASRLKSGNWDRLRVEQVVMNLLTNALKFGQGKPVIVATSQRGERGERAVFSVRDFGIGIARENHDRIFERLERAVSLKQFGGLGMGLFIARQIVELHGGRIFLESTEGAGSTFTVELPFD